MVFKNKVQLMLATQTMGYIDDLKKILGKINNSYEFRR